MKKLLIVLSFLILLAVIAILVRINYFDNGTSVISDEGSSSAVIETIDPGVETEPISELTTVEDITEGSDRTAPVISGLSQIVVHIDEEIDYLSHVKVTDDTDPNPVLNVDDSRVDLSAVGSYIAIYKAVDASGNTSYAACDVRVVSHDKVSDEQAEKLASNILSQIITNNMSDHEKLMAVWLYLHDLGNTEVFYGDWDDILENAYNFLDTGKGNKRCFFAASKLLIEALGYDTITITNVDDAVITHYWNLVSCDGGETYYHFDPSVWEWNDERVMMVTDEWLWSYSSRHDFRCYDWDSSYYPETPEYDFE